MSQPCSFIALGKLVQRCPTMLCMAQPCGLSAGLQAEHCLPLPPSPGGQGQQPRLVLTWCSGVSTFPATQAVPTSMPTPGRGHRGAQAPTACQAHPWLAEPWLWAPVLAAGAAVVPGGPWQHPGSRRGAPAVMGAAGRAAVLYRGRGPGRAWRRAPHARGPWAGCQPQVGAAGAPYGRGAAACPQPGAARGVAAHRRGGLARAGRWHAAAGRGRRPLLSASAAQC